MRERIEGRPPCLGREPRRGRSPARALGALSLVCALSLAPAAARAQFPITQSFEGSSAPGWSLLGTAALTGTGAIDPVGQGWLRLTSATTGQAGSAIYNTAFSSSAGIVVTFTYADYGGTGADGFSFYLIDGSTATPTVGQPGGPLGYSANYVNSTCATGPLVASGPGVTNGYVGIGFDEYGNFSSCLAGVASPGRTPQSVLIRGSGSLSAGTAFRYLAGTTLNAIVSGATVNGVARASARPVRISIINQKIKVEMDLGAGYQTVINSYDLSTATGQVALPATFKMGFSGSTGASTDYHEIRNLQVTQPVNLGLSQASSPSSVTVGQTVTFTITITNDGTNVANPVGISDVFPAGLSGVTWTTATTGGASASPATGSGNLSGTLDLPRNSSVTFTVTATVLPSAAGTSLANTVTLTPPAGENNLLTSTSLAMVPVAQMSSATALASSPNPSTYGETAALSATVTSAVAGIPSGTVAFYDGATGLGSAALDATGLATLSVSALAGGSHSLTAVYAGDTNYSGSASAAVAQAVEAAPTGVSLSASLPTLTFGSGVQLTAAVAPTGSGIVVPTGQVTFYDGSTILGNGTLDATGQATLSASGLAVGTHSLTASYAGDGNYLASTTPAPTVEIVTPAAAAVALSPAPSPAVYGQGVTLTAIVSSAAGTPTGTVTFADGATVLGSSPLQAGVATLSAPALGAGAHALGASYGGDASFAAATSPPVSLTVNPASTSTALVATPSPASYGQSVTLTASVTAVAPGSGTPSGTVTFKDGATVLGTASLAGGTASFATAALAGGSHALVAQYGGDASFAGSASGATSLQVAKGPSAAALSASANPSTYGSALALTATVTGAGSTPTGTVAFADGSTTLCAGAALDATGRATCAASELAGGTHALTVSYSGDGNNGASSGNLSLTVTPSAAGVALAPSANPVQYGAAVALVATVTGPGATPTGTVTFTDGGAALCTAVALSGSGAASCSAPLLSGGSHSIQAAYSGDGNYLAASASLVEAVSPAPSSVLLGSSANPVPYGMPLTLSAAVSGAGTTPTGTVTFADGGTALCAAVALDASGAASCVTSSLAGGAHALTASYAGDANHAGASGNLAETITPASSSVALATSEPVAAPGDAVTLTATVAPAAATGTVTFSSGSTALGTAAVSAGVATLTTSSLAPGTYGLTAGYGGDSNYAGSASGQVVEEVLAPFPIGEPFANDTAPGWSLAGDAALTGGSSDPLGQGWLDLTGAASPESGSAVYGAPFSASSGIVVAFDYATWGGTGGDGLAFYLLDGATVSPAPGAPAGGLGYASSSATCGGPPSQAGVTNGYLGIGLDEGGGFSSCTTGAGGPGSAPDSVVLRGSGSGLSGGFGYLAGAPVPGGVATGGRPAARPVRISIVGQALRVEIDEGSGFETVLGPVDLSSAPGQVPVPATFRMGFAGSTSALTDLHEVENLLVTLPVNLAATVTPGPATGVSGAVSFAVAVSNDGTNDASPVSISVPVPAGLGGATWSVTGSTGGASAASPAGSGDLSTTVDLPRNSSLTFTVTGTALPSAAGADLSLAVAVTPPASETNLLSGTASARVPVGEMASAVALASSGSPSLYGAAVALTATVTSPVSGTPSGSVTFYDGASELGTATLDASGVATLSAPALAGGLHSLTASYGGSSAYQPSASPALSQEVDPAPTSVALASSLPAATFGTAVLLTATVTPLGYGPASPTGTVTFSDGGASLGTAALDASGVATLSVPALGTGAHSLTASYAGDGNYGSATSAPFAEMVSPATPAVALAASLSSSVYGQAVTFTATVSSPAGAPGGTVTFEDGALPLGSAPLSGGVATLTVSSLGAGAHSVAATYGGDASFGAAVSLPFGVTVSQAATSVALAAVPSSSTAGYPVTLTATVTASAPGAGAPTGSVVFLDGASSLGTAALGSGGGAALTTEALSQGAHALGASYAGDANFLPSTSAAVPEVVEAAPRPGALAAVSGGGQDAPVFTSFAAPLVVLVQDGKGNPLPGVQVNFAAPASGASAVLSQSAAITDSSGEARVSASANTVAGTYDVTASMPGVASPVTFTLRNDPGAPASLAADPADQAQTAEVGTAFAAPLAVIATDRYGNPVPGVAVAFAAPAGGATASLSGVSAATDASGRAQVTATASSSAGSYAVTASAGTLSTEFDLANSLGAPLVLVAVSGGGEHAAVSTAFASPLVVEVRDAQGNPVPGAPVSFEAPLEGASARLSAQAMLTRADGTLSVGAGANGVAGSYRVVATASGASRPVAFALVNDPGAPASVIALSGCASQSAEVGTPFAVPLSVRVEDAFGNPVPGVAVSFAAPASGPTAALSAPTATTGADGTASVVATAGTAAGSYTASAAVAGVSAKATFSLANQVGAPGAIAVASGSPQSAAAGAAFAQPLEAVVLDAYGNPLQGVLVTFVAPASGAAAALSSPSATTGADGKASVTASAGTQAGSLLVAATAPGVSAPALFSLANLPGPAVSLVARAGCSGQSARVGEPFANALSLTAVDAYGNGVPGVAVAFACPASPATCTLDRSSTVTGPGGVATVQAAAGTLPGAVEVVATAGGLAPVQFALTALVGLPGSVEAVSGGSQAAAVFASYSTALGVRVTDGDGNPVPGVEVDYQVVSAGAQSVAFSSPSAVTDSNGLASVSATANSAKGTVSVAASVAGAAAPALFSLTNVGVTTSLSVDIVLPVYSTVMESSGVTHLKVTVGPPAGGAPPTGTVTFRSTRPVELLGGQAGATQAGDAVVATLASGAADVKVQVIGWRSRSLTVDYAPDAASASTFEPASATVNLTADVQDQKSGSGCSTGGGGALALLPLALLAARRLGRRRASRKRGALARRVPLASLALLAALAPRPAAAQLELGLRAGYAVPVGDAEKGSPLSSSIAGYFPFELDAGYRVIPNLTVGAYASLGPALAGSICGGASCSGSVLRLGVQAAWHFAPIEALLGAAPWAGAGLGCEWASYGATQGSDRLQVSLSGVEFLNLQGGADFRVWRGLSVGPFLEVSLGEYGSLEVKSPLGNSSGGIPDRALHSWISFGVRGTYLFDL